MEGYIYKSFAAFAESINRIEVDSIQIRARGKAMEVRGEAFNLTNSYRAGVSSGLTTGLLGVNTTFTGSGNFGQITSALDPRIMQVAMKLIF